MNIDYSKVILELRSKLNVSQEEFGKLIGASLASVSRWERVKYEPTKIVKVRLNKILSENKIISD